MKPPPISIESDADRRIPGDVSTALCVSLCSLCIHEEAQRNAYRSLSMIYSTFQYKRHIILLALDFSRSMHTPYPRGGCKADYEGGTLVHYFQDFENDCD